MHLILIFIAIIAIMYKCAHLDPYKCNVVSKGLLEQVTYNVVSTQDDLIGPSVLQSVPMEALTPAHT